MDADIQSNSKPAHSFVH